MLRNSAVKSRTSQSRLLRWDPSSSSKWPATKIESYQKALVPGIWLSTILSGKPNLDLSKANHSSQFIQSSIGDWNKESKDLSGKVTTISFGGKKQKPRLHHGMISIEIDSHEHRDLPGKTQPEPRQIRITIDGDSEIEALVRPLPTQKKISEWCKDMVDAQMSKLPDGSLGRSEVEKVIKALRNSAEELWSDPDNQTKTWNNELMKNLESVDFDSVLSRYRNEGEWELQYRIDEKEVFQSAD